LDYEGKNYNFDVPKNVKIDYLKELSSKLFKSDKKLLELMCNNIKIDGKNEDILIQDLIPKDKTSTILTVQMNEDLQKEKIESKELPSPKKTIEIKNEKKESKGIKNSLPNNNDDIYDSKVNSEDGQTLNLSKLEDKIPLNFDYEMNMTKLEDKDSSESKLLYLDDKTNQYKPINYNLFFDKLRPLPKIKPSKDPKKAINDSSKYDVEFEELDDSGINNDNLKKANFFKRLVSKQKRRFQDSNFDLDMSYITDKVIAMGFPSTGMEVMYRNSLSDIIKFFHVRHNDEVKVYNLCLEKDRIYNKDVFPNSKVGLFPATDHNPSPIKLILEFCIDICLYLIKNPKGVAAVHCKAGKGRTGVMICSYLVFSGLCQTSEKAFRYYARVRTKNNTGVTIASQKRYIKYFETFLESNFYPPYINLIPKIIRSHFSFLIDGNDIVKINNILQSFQREKSYFISSNTFKLKKIKLGPLPKGKELKLKICNFVNNKFKFEFFAFW